MKILLDSNIILDVLSLRKPFYDDAAGVIEYCSNNGIEMLISTVSISDVHYILSKHANKMTAYSSLTELLKHTTCVVATCDHFTVALNKGPKFDFEDQVQINIAITAKVDYIITRDLKDYRNSPIPVYSPAQFLAVIGN